MFIREIRNSNNYRTHKIIDLNVSDVEAVSSVASSGKAAPVAAAPTDKSSLVADNVTQPMKNGNKNQIGVCR